MAINERKKRLPRRTAYPLGRIFSNLRYREALGLSQEPALNHCVIDVIELGGAEIELRSNRRIAKSSITFEI